MNPTRTVLLVDDDPSLRSLLHKVLSRANYTVHVASNGREAIQLFQSHPADVVVTDIIMPEMEGIETILTLRRMNPNVPIIAMSGGGRVDSVEYLRLCRACGVAATLSKPFTHEELLRTLDQSGQRSTSVGAPAFEAPPEVIPHPGRIDLHPH